MDRIFVPAGLLQFCASVVAVLAARRRKEIWPIAGLLVINNIADLLRRALEVAGVFSAEGPYVGMPRLFFHMEEALLLCWPFGLLSAVMIVLFRRSARGPFLGWVLAVGVTSLMYPSLRGARLQHFYLAIEVFTVAVTACGFVSWWISEKWLSRPGPEIAALLVLFFIEVAGTFGPFLHDLFIDYAKIQALNVGLYAGLVLIYGGFLVWTYKAG